MPTGSMNTRSALSSQVASLSTRRNGGAGIVGSAGVAPAAGRSAPMCSQSDAEPGPPLKLNKSGRASVAFTSASVWAMKKIRASTSPFHYGSASTRRSTCSSGFARPPAPNDA